MCGINLEKFHKDKVYEIADVLYRVKELIEPALFRSAAELFPSERRLFLFDLTNTYFEGNTKGNTLAKYGHSKEKRYDATLVSLALLVDDREYGHENCMNMATKTAYGNTRRVVEV